MRTNISNPIYSNLSITAMLAVIFMVFLCSNAAFAQRVTNINNKGTKLTTGNIVTEAATAPTTPAPIQGDIWFDTTNNLYKVWDGTVWKTVVSTASLEPWFGVDDNAAATDNTEDMYVMGNVGIGTPAPTYKLEVAGANSDALINGVRVGKGAGDDLRNTALGAETLNSNTTGIRNTAVGRFALTNLDTGNNNTAVGMNAQLLNISGSDNIGMGLDALRLNTAGNHNVGIGVSALANTTDHSNVGIGSYALTVNTDGLRNVALGYAALQHMTTGHDNIGLGFGAGRYIVGAGDLSNATSNNSIFIGREAKALADNQTNQIVIGHLAEGIGSNTVVLGNNAVVTTALKGDVGIGTTDPHASAILEVNAANKGALLPHVPLTSLIDVATIPSPAHGLTVFATGGTLEEGYYYYDTDAANAGANASWKKMGSSAVVTPMVFSAEYAGAALYADGADNLGFMTSDNAGAANSWMNFYHWENTETDGGTNDYDIILRFTLPQNFVSWETNAIEIDYAGTADANFTADVYVESNGTAQASLSATAGTGIATWSTATIANTGLTLTAGDTGVIVLHLTATDVATAGASAIRLGDVTLNFKSNN